MTNANKWGIIGGVSMVFGCVASIVSAISNTKVTEAYIDQRCEEIIYEAQNKNKEEVVAKKEES